MFYPLSNIPFAISCYVTTVFCISGKEIGSWVLTLQMCLCMESTLANAESNSIFWANQKSRVLMGRLAEKEYKPH